MAGTADFTAQEWESLQQGITGACLLVSLGDRSFFDTFNEAGALEKHIAQAKQGNPSQPAWSAKAALASKAPDELESYRQFGVEAAPSVAEAAGGGEIAESGAIEELSSALR